MHTQITRALAQMHGWEGGGGAASCPPCKHPSRPMRAPPVRHHTRNLWVSGPFAVPKSSVYVTFVRHVRMHVCLNTRVKLVDLARVFDRHGETDSARPLRGSLLAKLAKQVGESALAKALEFRRGLCWGAHCWEGTGGEVAKACRLACRQERERESRSGPYTTHTLHYITLLTPLNVRQSWGEAFGQQATTASVLGQRDQCRLAATVSRMLQQRELFLQGGGA